MSHGRFDRDFMTQNILPLAVARLSQGKSQELNQGQLLRCDERCHERFTVQYARDRKNHFPGRSSRRRSDIVHRASVSETASNAVRVLGV